jgi:hypothetical protein
MTSPRAFSEPLLAALRDGKIVRIRAGARHRFIGISGVVVESRIFVRSWSIKARSWYRTFLKDPDGFIQLDNRAIPVRAIRTRSARLKAAVDRAYLRKYRTPWEMRFAKDLTSPKSRATTIELRPAPAQRPNKRLKLTARVD